MNSKTTNSFVKTLQSLNINKDTKTGIFIDEANLFYIQKELGWKIDWEKFSKLWGENLNLKQLRYYIGTPPYEPAKTKNKKVQEKLKKYHYTIVNKPLKKIYTSDKKQYIFKCNFDVEIALDVASFIPTLDLVIIVSGDSDFIAIRDYVLKQNKKIIFLCFNKRTAWEIRRCKHIFLEEIKKTIEFNKKPRTSRGGITK